MRPGHRSLSENPCVRLARAAGRLARTQSARRGSATQAGQDAARCAAGPPGVRRGFWTGSRGALALAFILALALVGVAGCGNSPSEEGEEGEPIQLGELEINVQLTRFLNPTDHEDKDYLAGQPLPPPANEAYLGVFLTMDNHADSETQVPSADAMTVVDTTGAGYQAVESNTPFAVPLGTVLAGHGVIPVPDSPAQSGPAQGALALFLVDQGVSENRPLKLEVEHDGETGDVTLDI